MKRLLREPLLHFLMLGAALFAVFSLVNRPGEGPSGQIVVSAGRLDHLTAGFTRTWRRPPTTEELNGLIRDYVREEIYYREAKAMGLDQDDSIVRRRLQQKLEFISEDIAALNEPSDADLAALLESQPDRFRVGRSYSFSHVYLNPERQPADLAAAANVLLTKLGNEGQTTDISAVGDRFLLGSRFDAIPASEAAKIFGASFASRLGDVATGKWQGPIQSGYGLHLVLMEQRTDGRLPGVEEAREHLRREWKEIQRRKANEEFFTKLLSRYTVTVESAAAPSVAASDSGAVVQR
jgi:hypothetical protein